MRTGSWTLLILLVVGSAVLAQGKLEPLPEKKAPASGATDEKLGGLLKDWEAKMKRVDRFMVDCKRIETDDLKGKSRTYVGQARYLKPNFALLDLASPEDKTDRELMVSNGEKLYEFKLRDKLVMIHEMPKNGAANDQTFLNFLLGLESAEVQKRYELTLKKAVDGEGYIYISILPRYPADKQEFKEAELVLYSRWIAEIAPKNPAREEWALLPARLWFKAPNGNQSTWMFENYDLKANLKEGSFIPPKWPADWKTEVVKQGGGNAPPVQLKEDPKVKSAPKSKLSPEK